MIKLFRWQCISFGVALVITFLQKEGDAIHITSSLRANTTPQYFYSHRQFPQDYPVNYTHDWTISTDLDNQTVVINLTSCKIEYVDKKGTCLNDVVLIYDGTNENDTELGRTCCSNPNMLPSFISTGPNMFIRFETDYSIGGSGFRIRYYSTGMMTTSTLSTMEYSYEQHVTGTTEKVSNKDSSGSILPYILGGSIGGIIFLILVAVCVVCLIFSLLKKDVSPLQISDAKLTDAPPIVDSSSSAAGSESLTSAPFDKDLQPFGYTTKADSLDFNKRILPPIKHSL